MANQPTSANQPPAHLWVLLGARHGDNQQLLAIAEALNLPYRTIPLRFNAAANVPPALLGRSRLSWRSDTPIGAPWPRAILAAGRKSVPAALWIRRRSAHAVRLIHVNRPRAPLAWFDLVITTPQYALPSRPNVVANLLPFVEPPTPDDRPLPASLHESAARLPRPWTVVLVGGNSPPYAFDDASAVRLAALVDAQVRASGGSAWVLDSPRTPRAALPTIERGLGVPSRLVRWRDQEQAYRPLLDLADRFIVTADSASMLAEALGTGRPVTAVSLPARPGWHWRFASAWRRAALHAPDSAMARGFEVARSLGLSFRDIGLFERALRDRGAFDTTGLAKELAERERAATLKRIDKVIGRP